MTGQEKYMNRCLQLAANGRQNTAPNPMVGCVIVHNNKIIGEGYHRKYGEAHAEVNAINSVKNPELLKDSTLFVNLEPCAHHGKTPPCSDLIIRKKIPRVVIGTKDIYAEVAGKGIEKMQKAGIEVITGVLEKESLELNKRFFTFHGKKRPYVILKWAETSDGFIDTERKSGDTGINWITGKHLRIAVHKLRSEESAILVGTDTARIDNPMLNTRLWHGKNPVRFVIDRSLSLPPSLHLFDGKIPTYIFTEKTATGKTNLNYITLDFGNNLPEQIVAELYKLELQSVIIEGGKKTIQSFIDAGLWDEAIIFRGNKTFGKGLKAPETGRTATEVINISGDRIIRIKATDKVYFQP
jgi:diaminohydroxyphosphoribosylaminopyrimidine deaminase/5-amino-6-(5-phosphoribosylamino)uracil reductase